MTFSWEVDPTFHFCYFIVNSIWKLHFLAYCVCNLSVCPRFTRINHFSKSYTLILNLHDKTVLKVETTFVFYLFKWEITCDWPRWLVVSIHSMHFLWFGYSLISLLFFRHSCCTITPTLICTEMKTSHFFQCQLEKKKRKKKNIRLVQLCRLIACRIIFVHIFSGYATESTKHRWFVGFSLQRFQRIDM